MKEEISSSKKKNEGGDSTGVTPKTEQNLG
jgi:hypothetical protein